jgi:peroxiredoxin
LSVNGVPSVAPPFDLPTGRGEKRRLSELLAHSRVLLIFHRGTW